MVSIHYTFAYLYIESSAPQLPGQVAVLTKQFILVNTDMLVAW